MASDFIPDRARLEGIGRDLLLALGSDPDSAALSDTPRRFAEMWSGFISYRDDSPNTTFDVEQVDQMVVVSGVRVWSMCEHHLLPFWCDVSMAYVASTKVLGLSKFGRIAHRVAHRLQVQERLVTMIADEISVATEARDVAVVASGEHLCMTMRGVRTSALMTSSAMRGVFRSDAAARAEFFRLAGR